ncbi:hypothetical protein [Methanococcus sp. CF]
MSNTEENFKKLLINTLFILSIILAVPVLLCIFGTGNHVEGIFFSVVISFLILVGVIRKRKDMVAFIRRNIYENERHFHIKKLKKEGDEKEDE